MPTQLLPASAAAFAPRAAPNIVLDTKVEPWLTQTLKRVNKVKRALNKPEQHRRCLTDMLAGERAIWNLTSLLLPKAPESELSKDDDEPLREAMANYNMLHVQAYVVHVDMVAGHEVAFKLTKDTIDALVDYHRDIYTVDAAANLYSWPEKEGQVKKMQQDFVQAANRFVFRTDHHALEGLEEDGAGELLAGRSEAVKLAIMQLFSPLLPPPPRIVDVVIPAATTTTTLMQHRHVAAPWWQQHSYSPLQPAQPDQWQVTSSGFAVDTPSPTVAHSTELQNRWWPSASAEPMMEPKMEPPHMSSPTPSAGHLDYSSCDSSNFSTPEPVPVLQSFPLETANKDALCLFPSQMSCGPSIVMDGFDTFGWEYNDFAPQYAATM